MSHPIRCEHTAVVALRACISPTRRVAGGNAAWQDFIR
jgi:hypothetical protein